MVNLYAYVSNDPINFIDPNGLQEINLGVPGSESALFNTLGQLITGTSNPQAAIDNAVPSNESLAAGADAVADAALLVAAVAPAMGQPQAVPPALLIGIPAALMAQALKPDTTGVFGDAAIDTIVTPLPPYAEGPIGYTLKEGLEIYRSNQGQFCE